jgi:hypothetical protein
LSSYAYIAGTTQAPAGPAFTEGDNAFSAATGIPANIESAVWSYDPDTQAITAQWINTDGSTPATHIVYATERKTLFSYSMILFLTLMSLTESLILTGDVETFGSTFGAAYPEVVSLP